MNKLNTTTSGQYELLGQCEETLKVHTDPQWLLDAVVNDFGVLSLEPTTLEDSCVTESVVVRHKVTKQLFKAVA